MAPHPIPLPCALAFLPPSHRDATTPSPCWASHFMTQERIMFSNPTPSEPRLSPATTKSKSRHRLSLCPCTAPLSYSLQHLLKLSLFSLSPSESFHPIPLPCALAFPPLSHRDTTTLSPSWAPHFMTQSLLGPSFHDPGTHHVLESHPEQAAPLSRRDNRCHDIVSHSALALRLYLAACSPSSSCRFSVLDHLCSNLSQSINFC